MEDVSQVLRLTCAIHLNAWTHGNVGLLSCALSEEYYEKKRLSSYVNNLSLVDSVF